MPLIIATAQAFDVGVHTLQSFVSSHGAMRLKNKWSTNLMIPEKFTSHWPATWTLASIGV
jgi:hypothetical protein